MMRTFEGIAETESQCNLNEINLRQKILRHRIERWIILILVTAITVHNNSAECLILSSRFCDYRCLKWWLMSCFRPFLKSLFMIILPSNRKTKRSWKNLIKEVMKSKKKKKIIFKWCILSLSRFITFWLLRIQQSAAKIPTCHLALLLATIT